MKRSVFALAPIALALVIVQACGSSVGETGTGGSSGDGGAAAGQGGASSSNGGSGGAIATSTSTTATGAGCTVGSQKCDAGKHLVCTATGYVEEPCDAGQGCDEATGACAPCVCDPNQSATCKDATTTESCDASCTKVVDTACTGGDVCAGGACVAQVCSPGTADCVDDATSKVCNADGTGYDAGVACGPKEKCTPGKGCTSLCDIAANAPSSVGCSFFGLNMWNFNDSNADAIIVGNTNASLTASVTFYTSYGGNEVAQQANVQIPPNGLHQFNLPNSSQDIITGSGLRTGGSFRVESDIPVIAYQHSPVAPQATNDASVLLPESALGKKYVAASYTDTLGSYPSYIDVIATQNGTQVTVTVPSGTKAGTGVPALSAGASQTFTMNRYDTLQIASNSGGDITGAVIEASAPVSVFGAVQCTDIPAGATYCDHVEEQMLPLRNWGKTYVGAHIPKRSNTEKYIWRVVAYQDGTTIDTTPTQPGFPKTLNANQFYEFQTQQSFVFTGNKPFMPFQYISSQNYSGAGTGDPAQITAVPVEQFLSHYVVLTPSGYSYDYYQIIRTTADDVLVDGVPIPANEYYAVGSYTVADHKVTAGTHVLQSAAPFGVAGIGYTAVTSYGYPGGMGLVNLNP